MAILLVNFGGPRTLGEVESFLIELLCDRELIRTRLPTFAHHFLFRRIAKKRAPKVIPDYESIGGKSPIYETTEVIAENLRKKLQTTVLTFHRYLPSTHKASLLAIEACKDPEIRVFPFFPQFSFATTGSIATLFAKQLSPQTLKKLSWIKSYPAHPAFIESWQRKIRLFLKEHNLEEKETALLFSAHGLPRSFVDEGDPYEKECNASFQTVLSAFPNAIGKLSYQSKFGRGEWLRPYTQDSSEDISWTQKRKNVVFVPLAFTSDHIETLFEIEQLYLPLVRSKGLGALRCPAFNLADFWIDAILRILEDGPLCAIEDLLRTPKFAIKFLS